MIEEVCQGICAPPKEFKDAMKGGGNVGKSERMLFLLSNKKF